MAISIHESSVFSFFFKFTHTFSLLGNHGAKSANAVGYPAEHRNVICVGACGEYGHATETSSRGKIDFLCPGQQVLKSSRPGG